MNADDSIVEFLRTITSHPCWCFGPNFKEKDLDKDKQEPCQPLNENQSSPLPQIAFAQLDGWSVEKESPNNYILKRHGQRIRRVSPGDK